MAKAIKQTTGVLEGIITYAKIAQADKKYQSNDMEYSIQVLIDKATAKQWNKDFPKQKAKETEADEFEEKYRIEIPEEFAGQDTIYSVTLKKAAVKDGVAFDEKYRPRVFLDTKDEEGEDVRVEITTSRLIANGSKGKVSYRITSNDFGTFAQLQNVLVNDEGFIEYTPSGGAGSEFGDAPKKTAKEPENKAATQGRKPKAEKPSASEEDDGSDPF